MKDCIYHDKNLRCKLKTTGYENQIELKIQRRFSIFWVSVKGWSLYVKEGYWGESFPFSNPFLFDKIYDSKGNEGWKTGTLNLPSRVREFFKEYLNYQNPLVSANNKILNACK